MHIDRQKRDGCLQQGMAVGGRGPKRTAGGRGPPGYEEASFHNQLLELKGKDKKAGTPHLPGGKKFLQKKRGRGGDFQGPGLGVRDKGRDWLWKKREKDKVWKDLGP